MTVRHLKIFIAVADTGKMSQAAEQLYISQPTVSQAIRELEEHYHVQLFERYAKKLYITEAGRHLLGLARVAVEQFDRLEEEMSGEGMKERLKIGVTRTVGSFLLSRLLQDFRKSCPQTEIYAYVGNTRMLEERLLNAELDLGIVEGRVKSPELVSIPMIEDVLVLACARTHPFAEKEVLDVRDLEGLDFVMREEGSGTRALFEEYLDKNKISIHIRMEASEIDVIRNAILENGCLAVVSSRLLEKEIRSGEVKIFDSREHAWNRSFSLVYHKNKRFTEGMQYVKELLQNYDTGEYLEENAGYIAVRE